MLAGHVSPTSAASVEGNTDAGDRNDATLFFGSLHPQVQQQSLEDICKIFGEVESAKLIKDKETGISAGYGFVKFADRKSAEVALKALNQTECLGQELRVNWCMPNAQKEDTSHHCHVFVGDLGSDVSDSMLFNTFSAIGQCSDARVMWDHSTGRSKGYGFVSFRRREDAEAAILNMQGKQIGSRRIRVGWAQHKQEENSSPPDFASIDRADPSNTNVYIGNLSPETTEADISAHFAAFGPIVEVKLHKKGGFGFVKFEQHESAVQSIVGNNGMELHGRVLKCSWGKNGNSANQSVGSHGSLGAGLVQHAARHSKVRGMYAGHAAAAGPRRNKTVPSSMAASNHALAYGNGPAAGQFNAGRFNANLHQMLMGARYPDTSRPLLDSAGHRNQGSEFGLAGLQGAAGYGQQGNQSYMDAGHQAMMLNQAGIQVDHVHALAAQLLMMQQAGQHSKLGVSSLHSQPAVPDAIPQTVNLPGMGLPAGLRLDQHDAVFGGGRSYGGFDEADPSMPQQYRMMSMMM